MISQHYMQYLDCVLSEQDLGLPALIGLEVAVGFLRWYYANSYPYIVRQQEDAHIPRPPEQEAINEDAVEEHGDQWLDGVSQNTMSIRGVKRLSSSMYCPSYSIKKKY
jgi:hypothetical protein